MSNKVKIDALKPGMVIVQITQQYGPVRIRKSGLVTSQAMVDGLREMGVAEVEIDPEQTVEVAEPKLSQTQFLLKENAAPANASSVANTSHTDSLSRHEAMQDPQLAEQFNRSLFLPTAQEIPETWQVYLKHSAIFVTTVFLGLVLGFASYLGQHHWLQDSTELAVKNELSENAHSNANSLSTESATLDTEHAVEQTVDAANLVSSEATINGDSMAATKNVDSQHLSSQPSEQKGTKTKTEAAPIVLGTPPAENGFYLNRQGQVVQTSSDDSTINNIGAAQNSESLATTTQTAAAQAITNERDNTNDANSANGLSDTISPDLMKRFQQAMAEMEQQESLQDNGAAFSEDEWQTNETRVNTQQPEVPRVDQMPGWILSSLPRLSFSAHMYASEPADRWIKVNNTELGEGDWIDGELQVVQIEPQHVILNFRGHEFTMRALSEW